MLLNAGKLLLHHSLLSNFAIWFPPHFQHVETDAFRQGIWEKKCPASYPIFIFRQKCTTRNGFDMYSTTQEETTANCIERWDDFGKYQSLTEEEKWWNWNSNMKKTIVLLVTLLLCLLVICGLCNGSTTSRKSGINLRQVCLICFNLLL